MSEPNSLFIKVKISKENLNAFLNARPKSSTLNSNWLEWWDSRMMYSKPDLKDVLSFNVESNRHLLEHLLQDHYAFCKQEYNEEKNTWYFMSLQYSENYEEIIPMLSWIKDLATYTDESDTGAAFIYDHLWGDGTVMAYIEIQNKQGLLNKYDRVLQIDPDLLNEADSKLEKLTQQFE
ncbi:MULTISPECIES: hypothetical protein [Sphingobacterium]|jgi:hypothetical protein|uniref:hypothetical protein n=1 Tax=Sphingobacterium TaxID=28453 RepID=UPI000C0BDE21|nr:MULTISPECIES: hypothetical protein [Sphingobacterium]MCT1531050.1 hypothetical protein [Sphingobacterium daejeonense]